jgi:hydroxymethylpyrimidine/phosphomethylpyrimidine kinase
MPKLQTIPGALTIAGSDSGGGAGIQADLKTFASLGVHGTTVITCITAQNPSRVLAVHACPPEMVRSQLAAVFDGLAPAAAKTGMLYSSSIIRSVADFFRRHSSLPLVVDPVMVSTSGAPLLKPAAIRTLLTELLPQATLVTPNLPEAELLIGEKLDSVEALRRAARAINRRFHCAALVKGGHLAGLKQAVDIFFDGKEELLLSAPFLHGIKTHGTGCTYSAAITAGLAKGRTLVQAVEDGKQYVTQAIAQSHRVAGHTVLNSFWR